jgi:hypothetical protein
MRSSDLPNSACNARAFSWKNMIFSFGDRPLSLAVRFPDTAHHFNCFNLRFVHELIS